MEGHGKEKNSRSVQSRGQPLARARREQKKVTFLQKIHSTASQKGIISGTASRKRKKRKEPSKVFSTFAASLADQLDLVSADGKRNFKLPGKSINNLKAREKIAKDETKRMIQVLDHPQFQANPLAALTSHLTATLPPPPERTEVVKNDRQRMDKRTKRARRAAAAAVASASVPQNVMLE